MEMRNLTLQRKVKLTFFSLCAKLLYKIKGAFKIGVEEAVEAIGKKNKTNPDREYVSGCGHSVL